MKKLRFSTAKHYGIPAAILLLFLLIMFISPQLVGAMRDALILCATIIIPSLFPFIVLADLLTSTIPATKSTTDNNHICKRLFGVPPCGMIAFLMGALCGFPIGVKCAINLYENERLHPDELDRLLYFCNNTGPAFVITAIGCSMLNSAFWGIALYITQILSALLCGILFHFFPHPAYTGSLTATMTQPKKVHSIGSTFLKSVRDAVQNILTVCGMILAFSAVCCIFSAFVKNKKLLAILYGFFEVGGAAKQASLFFSSEPLFALLLLSFAVSFGGISVYLQSKVFLEKICPDTGRYLLAKLVQAAISCTLIFLLWIYLCLFS